MYVTTPVWSLLSDLLMIALLCVLLRCLLSDLLMIALLCVLLRCARSAYSWARSAAILVKALLDEDGLEEAWPLPPPTLRVHGSSEYLSESHYLGTASKRRHYALLAERLDNLALRFPLLLLLADSAVEELSGSRADSAGMAESIKLEARIHELESKADPVAGRTRYRKQPRRSGPSFKSGRCEASLPHVAVPAR